MRTIFDPITVTADSPAVAIALPDALTSVIHSNAVISLQIYECGAVVQLVGSTSQTKGSTVGIVGASDYNTEGGSFDVRGFELYVYAPSPTSITFIPVIIPRRA